MLWTELYCSIGIRKVVAFAILLAKPMQGHLFHKVVLWQVHAKAHSKQSRGKVATKKKGRITNSESVANKKGQHGRAGGVAKEANFQAVLAG